MTFFKKICSVITLLLLIMNNKTFSDPKSFIPNAPIINFRLPMFDKQGYQSWYIHGDQGIYVNDEEVDIIGMQLNIFSGDERELLEATIQSPKATILLHENGAKSKNEIQAKGNGYNLSGKDWNWDGKLKKVIINQDVKVIFDQPLTDLLAYEKI